MSYHRTCSPSKNESSHKDLIIGQLRDEIRELQLRETEYSEACERLRELEHKMETLTEEKLIFESKRIESQDENSKIIKDLNVEYQIAKNLTQDRENELADLQDEKKRTEDELQTKRISTTKLLHEIEEVKYRNNRNFVNRSDLNKNCKRKEEENVGLQQRIDDLEFSLQAQTDSNNANEKDLSATEDQLDMLRSKKNEADKERTYVSAERDDAKAKLAELNRLINQVESQILALERDLRHVRNYNMKYDAELDEETKAYQMENDRNDGLDVEVQRLENIFRDSQHQFEDIKNELRKNSNMFMQVDEDNKMLEIDIEKYKEAIRSLSVQNDELLYELEKITEQDESVRYILNRKSRIETLIVKAEEQVERNQVKEDDIRVTHTHTRTTYSEMREG